MSWPPRVSSSSSPRTCTVRCTPSLLSNREDYLSSLPRLLELDADILCEGHFGIFRGKEAIGSFIRRFMH